MRTTLGVSTTFETWSPTKTIAERAPAYGVPGVEVDGQDAVAVFEVVADAVARARAGEGPTLIEAHVTRAKGHYEGDAQQYRGPLVDYRDPIDVLSPRVPDAQTVIDQANADVASAYEDALAAPVADRDILWKDVFA